MCVRLCKSVCAQTGDYQAEAVPSKIDADGHSREEQWESRDFSCLSTSSCLASTFLHMRVLHFLLVFVGNHL